MILLITGGHGFCEALPGREREDYMAERMALGFALDMIGPSEVVAGVNDGADRWARIWCERRGVPVSDQRPDACVCFPGGYHPGGIPIYHVALK